MRKKFLFRARALQNDLMNKYANFQSRGIFLPYPRRLYHGISHSVVNPACEISHKHTHTRARVYEIRDRGPRDRSGTIDFYPPISAEPRGHSFSSHGGNR